MIPRTINQIWIGDIYEPPTELMNQWRVIAERMDVKYVLWTDETIRDVEFSCIDAINAIPEINGKADIIRWELILQFGGIFIDADSIPIEPLIEEFFTPQLIAGGDGTDIGFAAFENEKMRPNLVATGTMGFSRGHPLVADIVAWLRTNPSNLQTENAWMSVGPGCITRFLESGKYAQKVVVFPSFYFIPIHYTDHNNCYDGHEKVYAHQLWGTGECRYKRKLGNGVGVGGGGGGGVGGGGADMTLPKVFESPNIAVSILINSYNTPKKWIRECLDSIKKQKGNFMIELVWIDDGSTNQYSTDLQDELRWFAHTARHIMHPIKYHKMPENSGTRSAINYGISLCTNELIIKMDSDDIMISTRIQKQIAYMEENPQVVCCGGQLMQFHDVTKEQMRVTNHPLAITEADAKYSSWFMNHPTLCYRKWAVLEVGCYGIGPNLGEDRELELRLWERFGDDSLHNLPNILLLYRIHDKQLTY